MDLRQIQFTPIFHRHDCIERAGVKLEVQLEAVDSQGHGRGIGARLQPMSSGLHLENRFDVVCGSGAVVLLTAHALEMAFAAAMMTQKIAKFAFRSDVFRWTTSQACRRRRRRGRFDGSGRVSSRLGSMNNRNRQFAWGCGKTEMANIGLEPFGAFDDSFDGLEVGVLFLEQS